MKENVRLAATLNYLDEGETLSGGDLGVGRKTQILLQGDGDEANTILSGKCNRAEMWGINLKRGIEKDP